MKLRNCFIILVAFLFCITTYAQKVSPVPAFYRIEFKGVVIDTVYRVSKFSLRGLSTRQSEKVRDISSKNRIFVAGATIYTSEDSLYEKFTPIQVYRKYQLDTVQVIFDETLTQAVTIVMTYKKKEE